MITRIYSINIPQWERVQTAGGWSLRDLPPKIVQVEMQIDDVKLACTLAGRADRSKGRRSTRAGGMVRVKIVD